LQTVTWSFCQLSYPFEHFSPVLSRKEANTIYGLDELRLIFIFEKQK